MKKHPSDKASTGEKSRRLFLRKLGLLAGVSFVPGKNIAQAAASFSPRQSSLLSDEDICLSKFEIAVRESLADRPISEVMVAVGTSFLDTPYAAHTLEADGPERLVVNLRGLDCVTFVENTLAISRCVKRGTTGFADYTGQLQLIRYRGGEIDGYPSRLHYFSEWIHDNNQKGIVRDVTKEIGGIPYTKSIHFMSAHRESYRQLADESFFNAIRARESVLNNMDRYYIPKAKLKERPEVLRPGDIVGITTSIEGLDIIHTGVAIHTNGLVRYLHAPLSGGSVMISEESLADYLLARTGQTGIMVARPLQPN